MNFRKYISSFFSDVKQFVAYREVLGVDIGTVSVKAVHVKRVGERVVLENYALLETKEYLDRGNAAIQTSSLKIVERDTAELLRTLVREMHATTVNAIASIPMFGVFVVPIELPLVSFEETERLLGFQVRQYLPLQLEEVNLEWVKLDEFDTPRGVRYQRLLITAVPLSTIRTHQAVFKAAGLKLVGLEIETQALTRALLSPADPPTMILDIGGESTSISIIEHGNARRTGQSEYGGAALTQTVARTLGISASRAEELKRRRGLKTSQGEYDLSTSLTPFLDAILEECRRVAAAYERDTHIAVERLMIVGGGANLAGLTEYCAAQTGFKIQTPFPFARVEYPPVLEPAMKALSSEFAVALGLGRKFFETQK
jgi:type IV pilus assembly protein PilM